MKCKACGAPLKAGDEACEYCGTLTDYGERQQELRRQEQERMKKAATLPNMRYASLWFVLFAYAVTFGYYSPYWYISRAKSLNGLRSGSKLPVIFAVIYAVLCIAAFCLPGMHENLYLTYFVAFKIWSVVILLVPIISVWMSLRAKKILCNHARNYPYGENMSIYTAMCCIFGPMYLQYEVNKMIEAGIISRNI